MGVSSSMAVTLLNFDDTLTMQEELRRFIHSQVDLRDLRGTRLFCDQATLSQIAGRIRGKKGIFFLGSGDYHYVSYLLMQTVDRPFTLVLFDNHADIKFSPAFAFLSCSSWVAWALGLPNLKKAVIIGARPDSFIGVDPGLLRKVVYVPYKQVRGELCRLDRGTRPGRPPRRLRGPEDTFSRIITLIPTRSVYISVDKDVLHPRDAITNWEQGEMSLADLLLLLQAISRTREVCGVDICGEADLHPLDRLRPAGREAIRKNTQANVRIIQALLQTRTFKQVS
ncbi:hypothetical protein MGLY_15280 [Neomoorella glycerini]|uniref:Arginase family protein n=1 Tax=Neomoorella glycerini TaxID=55779 RepID=A0A6I5ZQ97_9FIRM|nr:arginase family protein [Moorella glycerini]QGP92164.1 hypothetical protein MGLY_15280 [Moorella glycerini]